MYARIENGNIVQFPYSKADHKARNVGATVPMVWTPEYMAIEGIVHVVVTSGLGDKSAQLIDGQYVLTWSN
jgi:hypothetical protein